MKQKKKFDTVCPVCNQPYKSEKMIINVRVHGHVVKRFCSYSCIYQHVKEKLDRQRAIDEAEAKKISYPEHFSGAT